MKKLTTISFAVMFVYAVMAAPVSAITVVFFTGDGDPEAVGFNAGSNSFDIETDENGAAPGFLYQSTSHVNTSPDVDPISLLGSEGYFVEARFKVLSNNLGADDGFGATFWVESDLGQSRFRLGTDQLHTSDPYSPAADGFSTLRVECASGCAAPDVILDGMNLGSIGFNSGITGSKVTFGNHSGAPRQRSFGTTLLSTKKSPSRPAWCCWPSGC